MRKQNKGWRQVLVLPSCEGTKERAGEAFRKAGSLLPRGEVAEERSRGMRLLGNPKSCRMNLQGHELKSLGLAYKVSNLVGGGRAQTLPRNKRVF